MPQPRLPSITPQHTLNQLPQGPKPLRPPLPLIREPKLLNKKHVMLKARIQVRLEAQLPDDAVMVAVDVRVDAIQALEDLLDGGAELRREGDAGGGREERGVREERGGPGE